uniref:Uncharacterized protein MANES_06G126700 n=1 Tax=Rhizophora mucronata TaxID=61149 RepID=A0A2P2M985_RHIMU
MGNKSSLSLNPSICKRCHFLTVEFLPLFAIECLVEWNNLLRINHVNKCIPNIAFVLEVNWQVKKIISSSTMLINCS